MRHTAVNREPTSAHRAFAQRESAPEKWLSKKFSPSVTGRLRLRIEYTYKALTEQEKLVSHVSPFRVITLEPLHVKWRDLSRVRPKKTSKVVHACSILKSQEVLHSHRYADTLETPASNSNCAQYQKNGSRLHL